MMPRKSTKADRQPTWTFKVLHALHDADDFLSFAQLMEVTGANYNQMAATLHHLKVNARAIDCLESGGHLYWFVTGDDKRSRTQDERTPEAKGSRMRRQKIKPPKPAKD